MKTRAYIKKNIAYLRTEIYIVSGTSDYVLQIENNVPVWKPFDNAKLIIK